MQIVHRQCPEARLVLVGDGELREEIQNRIAELGLQDCVRMAGYQSNVAEWLALAAFTVLPSFFEGLPLAAIESLAASRAVVATAVDGTVEVVLHEQTGLTVPAGDVPSLASAMLRLLTDQQLAQALGGNGCALVNRQFTREQQLRKTEQTYLELAAAATRRSSRDARQTAVAGGRTRS
jgi:glycosyltransferase involved in cell wall biosynthesis